jgi:phosphosulfolactate synthase (CoM biosynthesis protein A)
MRRENRNVDEIMDFFVLSRGSFLCSFSSHSLFFIKDQLKMPSDFIDLCMFVVYTSRLRQKKTIETDKKILREAEEKKKRTK